MATPRKTRNPMYAARGRLAALYQGGQPDPDEEAAARRALAAAKVEIAIQLALADDHAPTADQRKRLAGLLRGSA